MRPILKYGSEATIIVSTCIFAKLDIALNTLLKVRVASRLKPKTTSLTMAHSLKEKYNVVLGDAEYLLPMEKTPRYFSTSNLRLKYHSTPQHKSSDTELMKAVIETINVKCPDSEWLRIYFDGSSMLETGNNGAEGITPRLHSSWGPAHELWLRSFLSQPASTTTAGKYIPTLLGGNDVLAKNWEPIRTTSGKCRFGLCAESTPQDGRSVCLAANLTDKEESYREISRLYWLICQGWEFASQEDESAIIDIYTQALLLCRIACYLLHMNTCTKYKMI
ncbi:hypothetical protein J6590_085712 [Homalodisca vitripennis]|nr:hypothetical protein J6590_085712 [Homalodisca vitripennis]